MENVETLFKQVIDEISENWSKELSEFINYRKARNEASKNQNKQMIELFEAMGLDTKPLSSLLNTKSDESTKEIERIKVKHTKVQQVAKRIPAEVLKDRALKAAISPRVMRSLPPYHVEVFSTKDAKDKLSYGTGTDIPNYTFFDNILVAMGGGDDVVANFRNQWNFLFYYRPPITGNYNIRFDNVFRGSYSLRSTSRNLFPWMSRKPADVKIDILTDAYQNGQWKGFIQQNRLNNGITCCGQFSERWDRDFYTNHNFFFEGGVDVVLLNRVKFEVRAEGGGARAEVDFSTGDDKYFSCPWVHIAEPPTFIDQCKAWCSANPGQCP